MLKKGKGSMANRSTVRQMNLTLFLICLSTITLHVIIVTAEIRFCQSNEINVESTYQPGINPFYSCPHGLLLPEPLDLVVKEDFSSGRFCATENICNAGVTVCSRKRQMFTGQLLTGNFTVASNFELLENSDVLANPCKKTGIARKTLSRKKRTTAGETNILVNETATADQIDTTRRLFYFLANLNPEDVEPTDRLIKLLQNVFRTIDLRCDPSRLDPMFTNLTHKAFLWLIKQAAEGPPGGDIPLEEIQRIAGALDECGMKTNKPIRIIGPDCMENITHVVLEQEGIEGAWEYIYDDKVFKWGKYDPIVDAVWLAIDTLHGLCEHELATWGVTHSYETYMLRLLTPTLIETRWKTPTPLFRQEIFDHMLIAPMNESVAILDACCVAGWKSSSYIARNVRPIDMKRRRKKMKSKITAAGSNNRLLRKRRSLSTDTNALGNDKLSAYCLHSQQELEIRLNEIKQIKCLDN